MILRADANPRPLNISRSIYPSLPLSLSLSLYLYLFALGLLGWIMVGSGWKTIVLNGANGGSEIYVFPLLTTQEHTTYNGTPSAASNKTQ